MAQIEMREVAHSYLSNPLSEEHYALKRLNHIYESGESYAILGPSGCGKTTLLNIISGLIQPTQGQVFFDGRDITAMPPQARNIAQVFQFPVVYNTMTVADNLAFPLRNRKVDKTVVANRVQEIAEILELTDVLKRKAAGLSVDVKQKISLGRGLIRHDVAAILFDEPLTVIDPQLKWQLRRKLKEIHERFHLTLIYVTHDQLEALTFANKVIVMVEGQVVQMGSPQELFENPQHTFVGHFIGSPGMNFLHCSIADHEAAIVEGLRIPVSRSSLSKAKQVGGRIELGVRPEFLRFEAVADQRTVPVQITSVKELGQYKIVTARLGEQLLQVKVAEDEELPSNNPCHLVFPSQWTKLYANGRLMD